MATDLIIRSRGNEHVALAVYVFYFVYGLLFLFYYDIIIKVDWEKRFVNLSLGCLICWNGNVGLRR